MAEEAPGVGVVEALERDRDRVGPRSPRRPPVRQALASRCRRRGARGGGCPRAAARRCRGAGRSPSARPRARRPRCASRPGRRSGARRPTRHPARPRARRRHAATAAASWSPGMISATPSGGRSDRRGSRPAPPRAEGSSDDDSVIARHWPVRIVSPSPSRGSSATSRDLPIPGCPITVTRWGRWARLVRSSAQRRSSDSASRPTIGRSSRRRWLRASGSTLSSRQAWSGSRFPLAAIGATCSPMRCMPDERPRRLADQDVAGGGRLLEPGSHVHGVAHDERLALRRIPREHVAGVDADAGLDLPHLPHRVTHLERRPQRPQRVVLVHGGDAEDGHQRVADHLLDNAAVSLHGLADRRVEPRHHAAHDLGVGPLGERRRADDVAEEHGHGLSHLAGGGGVGAERRAARIAEARPVRVLLAALRALDHDFESTGSATRRMS